IQASKNSISAPSKLYTVVLIVKLWITVVALLIGYIILSRMLKRYAPQTNSVILSAADDDNNSKLRKDHTDEP
ncbi:hypothetical protein HDV00_010682, partial [Rhizophlyctis rosea]